MSEIEQEEKPEAAEGEQVADGELRVLARRKLLRIAIYTPPAIVGTLLLSRDAHGQTTPSCQPYQCKPNPCDPRPCEPMGCQPDQCKPRPEPP